MRGRLLCLLLLSCQTLLSFGQKDASVVRYDFDEPLGDEWTYIQEPVASCYKIHNGQLRLFGSATDLLDDKQPTFVGLPTNDAGFSMVTKLSLFETMDGDEAGLAVYQAPSGYVQCCLQNMRNSHRLKVRLSLKNIHVLLADRPVSILSEVWLRVVDDGQYYIFSFSVDGTRYSRLEKVDRSLLSPAVVGGGTGILAGLYAYHGSPKFQSGPSYADFDYVEYKHHEP